MGPNEPPFLALPGSSEYFLANSAKSPPAFTCFRTSVALVFAASTAFRASCRGFDQDVADCDLLGNTEFVPMLVVVRAQLLIANLGGGRQFIGIDQGVGDL